MGARLVSAVCPVYNNALTIARALDSVLCQDYANIEVIVGDDCSADATRDIVGAYSDSRLRVLHNDVNLGAPGNFERLLSLATGKYVFYASGDDYWHPSFISELVGALEQRGGICAMCAFIGVLPGRGSVPFYFSGSEIGSNAFSRSLLTGLDAAGRFTKNNMFIHGVFDTAVFKSVFRAEKLKNERLLLCELSGLGEFVYVPRILFEKAFKLYGGSNGHRKD